QPDPPGAQPVRPLPVFRWIVVAVLVVGLSAAAIFVPIPVVFLYLPGPVRDVEQLVKASEAKTYSSEGTLLMTTVSVDTRVTFVELVIAWVTPAQQVVMRDQVTGGQSLKELREQQAAQMRDSQNSAKQVALSELGFDRPTGKGALVLATVKDSPAAEELLQDDVIVAVDGQRVATTCDVGALIEAHEIGESIAITYRRDGRLRTFETKLTQIAPNDPRPFLGVHMRTIDFSFEPGVDVEFETGRIAGPSAGLMLALALYDQLTPDDLTGGHQIAGTGTLECDGEVGAIGGIQQKVAGASAEGAEVFLAPVGNVDEARAVADGIEIVSIATFGDALEYLNGLD
ncbi:MAG TPA: PDZ domain-containing protein, partial [Actinomycetota bacterium]|nr:PDZ domain-containing protein [Actinomycetota bacterium]